MTRPIRAVFFDWDHTLAFTRTAQNSSGERLARMFELAGLPYTQEQIERALQQYWADVDAGQRPAIVNPQTRREIARLYGYLFDYLGEEDKSWATMERLYGTYALLPTFLFSDSLPTLSELKRQGYKLGIISNHSSVARPVIERLTGDLVPPRHIVISEEVRVHKPAKTIFHHAAGRMRTQPENCLLVGDNLLVDAIGAVANGRFGCGIWLDRQGNGTSTTLPPDVTRITSLAQVPGILAGISDALQP